MASHAVVTVILDIVKLLEWCLISSFWYYVKDTIILPLSLHLLCSLRDVVFSLPGKASGIFIFILKCQWNYSENWATKYLKLNIKRPMQYDLYEFFICHLTSCMFPSGFFSVKRRNRMRFCRILLAW